LPPAASSPKVAGRQILGAVIGGIGVALHEETATDHPFGRFMTQNFADYHVPVNAAVQAIDVIFVDEQDPKASAKSASSAPPRRSRMPVYHATGERGRDLPITPDQLMRD
jgi:xanthine dehydrogenase YagR molybdenum-binding subunit